MTDGDSLPPAGTLATLRTDEIEKNPQNPRLIFDPEPMKILKESIENVGILVPVIVFRKKGVDPRTPNVKYVILDGERRWLCAKEIEKERRERNVTPVEVPVPANIHAEPTTLQNILMMFNIHQVREAWELTPTALMLEVLVRSFSRKSPRELAELTGLTESRVRQCQMLLTFDKKYLDMSLREKPRRITGDFFVQMYPVIELIKEHYPQLYKKLGRNGIVDRMVEKYEAGEIKAVTEFRDFANLIRAKEIGASPERINQTVNELVTTTASIRASYKQEAKQYWQAEKVRMAVERLNRNLSRLDFSNISRNAPLFSSLKELRRTIDRLLERK